MPAAVVVVVVVVVVVSVAVVVALCWLLTAPAIFVCVSAKNQYWVVFR